MILIHQISNIDLKYKNDIKECLLHNLANPVIEKVVVFSICKNIEKEIGMDLKSRKILLLKFDMNVFDMLNYGKKNTKDFVIYGSPFIKFDSDLNNILNFDHKKILKDDFSYYIFHKSLKIKSERDIDDILFGEKIKVFSKTKKLGYYNDNDFQSISYGWRVSKNFQKTDIPKADVPLEVAAKVDVPLEVVVKVDVTKEIVDVKKIEENVIKTPYYTRKLDVVIVSVNYNDFLLISLENNSKIFENITVVTSSSDFMCQKICKKFGVKCLVTDIMYEDDVLFNKGKAINEGIRSISEPDYILLLDADILVMEKIDVDSLEDNVLYTSNRYMIGGFDSYQSYVSGGLDEDDVFVLEKNEGFGFFQLFNYGMDIKYPEDSDDASSDDIRFRDRFHLKKSIENTILHLGKDSNWKGRKSKSFLDYEQFDALLEKKHDLVDKTFKICTFYYNPQKDAMREENFLKFLAQFEGYQDNILIGMVDYDGDLIIPGYLKKNILVMKGDRENPIWYKETLLNKMIDIVDDDYIIWMDNDLIYENLEWLKDIKSVVKDKDFVQLYKTINYLDENGFVVESQKSIISSGSDDINEMLGKNYKPGGSWIGKTSIMKKQRFFEKMYVGGGDTIFVYGLFGVREGRTLSLVKENNEYIWHCAVEWIKSCKKYRLGYLDVSINHLYHGDLRSRNYNDRYNGLRNKESVSIIIPAFKAKDFIKECIDSIVVQNDYEILIGIDNCLETLDYIKSFELPINAKVFFFNESFGPYYIRNTLSIISKYKNLLFFDADDIMSENMIQKSLNLIYFYKSVRWKFKNFENDFNPNIEYKTSYDCANGVFMIRKDTFMENNGFQPWRIGADTEFMYRVDKFEKVNYYSEIFFFRRRHMESLTKNKQTGMGTPERLAIQEKFEEHRRIGFPSPDLIHTKEAYVEVDLNMNI